MNDTAQPDRPDLRYGPSDKTPPEILVVDDEHDVGAELCEYLAPRFTGRVHAVTASSDALKAVADNPSIGVVVTDIRMPGMNGFELIEAIMSDPKAGQRPPQFIVITGHAGLPEAREAIRRGVADFLPKPFRLSDLKGAVEEAAARWATAIREQRLARVRRALVSRANRRTMLDRQRYVEEGRRALAAAASRHSFLARMSHEFRTPLNHIIGFADLLKSQSSGRHAEYAASIGEAGSRLLRLTDALLDIGEIDRDAAELLSEIDCAAWLAAVAARANRRVAPSQPQASLTSVCGGRYILAAPAAERILDELLDNAIRVGRTVTIDAQWTEDVLAFGVSDDGPGIQPETVDRPEVLFTRPDDALYLVKPGAGIGLMLSRLLCARIGGSITIEAPPSGVGTRMVARIPAIRLMAE